MSLIRARRTPPRAPLEPSGEPGHRTRGTAECRPSAARFRNAGTTIVGSPSLVDVKIMPTLVAAFLVSACGLSPLAGSPPTITLASKNGNQDAVQGSYCLHGAGGGVCADSVATYPREVTVVVAGDEVAVVIADAAVERSPGCHSDNEQDCIGSVTVRPLGCQRPEVQSLPLALGPETHWTVDLDPGAYQLDVHVHFKSSAARGDVSGSLGLIVADRTMADGPAAGVSEIQPSMQVCPFDAAIE